MVIERIYLPDECMQNALNAAKDSDVTRDLMASFYEDLLFCPHEQIDWPKINNAIIARWPKGLAYIKEKAWKLANSRGK